MLELEAFVPFHESVLWRIHDAYYAARGTDAWTQGDIPFLATSNYAIARQHAAFLIEVVASLERAGKLAPGAPVWVLEVASGAGTFAASFTRALDEGLGQPGRALAARLRYVLSDYAARSVLGAIQTPRLRRLAQEGRVVPALLDMRAPEGLVDLEGRPIGAPLVAAIANYAMCVAPLKVIQKARGTYAQKLVRVATDVPEGVAATADDLVQGYVDAPLRGQIMKGLVIESRYDPVELGDVFRDPLHAATVRALLEPFDEATVTYPDVFLDMIRALRSRLCEGGVVLVNDYGSCEREELSGLRDPRPAHFGNTLSHEMNFAIFEPFAREAGLSLLATRSPLRIVHTAALVNAAAAPEDVSRAFQATEVDCKDGEDMIDLNMAALTHLSENRALRAARLFQQCLEIDPGSAELAFRFGEACVQAGHARLALDALTRGAALEGAEEHDFDFQLGRAYFVLRRRDEALAAYRRSLAREDHAMTHFNIAQVLEALGDMRGAYLEYRRALKGEPEGDRAVTIMRRLIERFPPKLWEPGEVPEEI